MTAQTTQLEHLKTLLGAALERRRAGGAHAEFTRLQGRADGYMMALIDAGLVSQAELLTVVAAAREAVDGAASQRFELEAQHTVAA